MTVETAPMTAASSLFDGNSTVDAAIAAIIGELKKAQSQLTGARPPVAELRETLESHLKRQEAVKGKGAWYPYVGSGLGNGPLVELTDGSVKWDLINGIGVHMFGHSDVDLVETAIRAAMGDTVMQGNLQYNLDAIEFGELLLEEAESTTPLKHAFIINSGALANETALKLCMHKKDGKAPRVIAFRDCFMGRTTTMCQIGDSAAGRAGIPLTQQVDYMPFFDPAVGVEASVAKAMTTLNEHIHRYPGQHACFVMELIQGEGGFNIAPREFHEPLMKLCRENDIPIWIDEIQTFGRTTEMYYINALGLGAYADVLTLGKMSQVCACLYSDDLNPKPGLLSATFVGSTVGLKVGRRILERLRDGNYYGPDGRIAGLQNEFRTRMDRFIAAHAEWFPPLEDGLDLFGGVGGMMRFIPFGGDKQKVLAACNILFEEGVVCFSCGHGPWHIRFLVPVGVMKSQHFDEPFEILERSLARVAQERGS